jgi:hypothetical protein
MAAPTQRQRRSQEECVTPVSVSPTKKKKKNTLKEYDQKRWNCTIEDLGL